MRLAALLLVCAAAASAAPAKRPFTPEELLATRRLDDVRVSPNGRWVSFTVRQKSLDENRDVKDVWLQPLPAGAARPLTRNGRSEHARWLPDGRGLVIQREGQVWLYELGGGDPQKLTSLQGDADNATVSRDGKWLVFSSDVDPACSTKPPEELDACDRAKADALEKGKVKARVVDHLFARHWTDWKEGKRSHLFAQPLEGGTPRDLTPGDQDWPPFRLGAADDLDFAPDGELVVSSKASAHEAWSTNGDLFALRPNGTTARNLTAGNRGDDAQPRISPDGRWLAWTAQARDGYESDQWKLFLLDRKSGQKRLLADLDDDVGTIVWRRDSAGLVVSFNRKGRFYLASVGLDGKVAPFSPGPASGDFDLLPDGSAVLVDSGMNRPPELAHLPPGGRLRKLTSFNDAQYKGLDLGPAPEDLWVTAKDGARIHSFVLRPPGLQDGQRAPLLLLVHGGPQGSWEDVWGMRWNVAAFAARGYVVVAVDPHGSTGYGQKFKEEISGDWGGLAYDDLMRATDAAEKLPFVEPGHTCAAGASFGGYMIDWIAGHTDRFRCLVSHDGVFDMVSFYGSTEELWFPDWEFRGPYWQNRELYDRFSPSRFVQNFRTPTLVIQGELDFRVPVEQGLGMFTALQRRGIESRLLYFPDEGHWVLKPRNSQLWYRTVLDWIDGHAKR